MKALELAQTLEDYADLDAAEHVEPVVIQLELDAAAELRRLAEVNAELLGAINAVNLSAVSINPGEFAVNAHALISLSDAASKAKEQQ